MSHEFWKKCESAPAGVTEVSMDIPRQQLVNINPNQGGACGSLVHQNQQMGIQLANTMNTDPILGFIEDVNKAKKFKQAQKDFVSIQNDEDFERQVGFCQKNLMGALINFLPEDLRVSLPLPVTFSPKAYRWITDFSSSFNVDPCVAMSFLLGLVSIACRGKFFVSRHGNHSEVVTLYMLIMMASGKMKSPMLEAVLKPIKGLEHELVKKQSEEIELTKIKRKMFKKRIQQLEKIASKSGDIDEIAVEIHELTKTMPDKLYPPKLLLFKFTMEGLEQQMYEQGGKLAIAGAELGSFKQVSDAKDDLLLQAWDNELYVYRRRDEAIEIKRPCLSILLATQGRTAANLLGSDALCEDGLVGRFTCLVPSDLNASHGARATAEISAASVEWLESLVRYLYGIDAPEEGHKLRIAENGLRDWDLFYSETQTVASSYSAPALSSYNLKLAGTALRFAGILHLLETFESGGDFHKPISTYQVQQGISMARFYSQHARVALDMESDKVLKIAHRIVQFLKGWAGPYIPCREIYRALHLTKNDAMNALMRLEERNYIRLLKMGNSIRCVIHPLLQTMG